MNALGEPIVRVLIRDAAGVDHALDALIDTGFNHELTLPPERIRALRLPYAAPVQATQAGDVRVYVDCFRATIIWDGAPREVAVLEMEGTPLLGMALVAGRRLVVDAVPGGAVLIGTIPAA